MFAAQNPREKVPLISLCEPNAVLVYHALLKVALRIPNPPLGKKHFETYTCEGRRKSDRRIRGQWCNDHDHDRARCGTGWCSFLRRRVRHPDAGMPARIHREYFHQLHAGSVTIDPVKIFEYRQRFEVRSAHMEDA